MPLKAVLNNASAANTLAIDTSLTARSPLAIFVAAAYVNSRAASISHSFSAIRCFNTWNDDNDRPNCLRSLV